VADVPDKAGTGALYRLSLDYGDSLLNGTDFIGV